MLIALLAAGCTHSPPSDSNSGTGDAARGGTTSGPARRASDARRAYPLDSLPTGTIEVKKQTFRVWLAREDDPKRPGVTQEGLMFVPTSEIMDDQGMLFIFPDERQRGFWMLNTVAPLDIAFARADGTIVTIWQMPPQTLESYPSVEPAKFALEVKQGIFAARGIKEGDRLVIPPDVLKPAP